MKLSLAWIFDHIDADWKKQDIKNLVALFNQTTAEIEDFYTLSFDMSHFFMGMQKQVSSQGIVIDVPELGEEINMPARNTAEDMIPPSVKTPCFMIKKEGNGFRWATLADFGVEKGGFVPALDVAACDMNGKWRSLFEAEDIIIEVDNKSITHRPDMWGHRGFAREIAAFLRLPLRNAKSFLKEIPVQTFEHESQPTASTPFIIKNQAPKACSRFVGCYVSSIENKPTPLLTASRLLKVGSRPINALVDLTNYVMYDWGLSLHAYDATVIDQKQIVVRMAKEGEKIHLLDDTKRELTDRDLVIADAKKPMGIAGVMGGFADSLHSSTTSIFIESATFDAGTVRRTAQRYKIRTEASARFEKTLDPNQTIEAMQRFLKLVTDIGLHAKIADEMISVGHDTKPHVIEVSHEFLERRLGMPIPEDQIINNLSRLEFAVLKSFDAHKKVFYLVTVPSFRASKDIRIKEDIVEEVVRCFGFDKIEPKLPHIMRTPFDFSPVSRMQKIKDNLARAADMTEQQNYAMFDENFITNLGLIPDVSVQLLNPVSENYRRMITSLVPGLLKNIKENHVQQDSMSFFECGRIWKKQAEKPVENKSVAGIVFKKRATVNFYDWKFIINNLFATLGFNISKITWTKAEGGIDPWYQTNQTAVVRYDNKVVGVAGNADSGILNKLDTNVPCDAFVFELDGDFLMTAPLPLPHYHGISKFQETYVDISLFVPLKLEAATLEKTIIQTSPLIKNVYLVDFFEKEGVQQLIEGVNQDVRALTFRIWLGRDEKTLEKAEIDEVWQRVSAAVSSYGVKVRM